LKHVTTLLGCRFYDGFFTEKGERHLQDLVISTCKIFLCASEFVGAVPHKARARCYDFAVNIGASGIIIKIFDAVSPNIRAFFRA
jgi:hypothetical protein